MSHAFFNATKFFFASIWYSKKKGKLSKLMKICTVLNITEASAIFSYLVDNNPNKHQSANRLQATGITSFGYRQGYRAVPVSKTCPFPNGACIKKNLCTVLFS